MRIWIVQNSKGQFECATNDVWRALGMATDCPESHDRSICRLVEVERISGLGPWCNTTIYRDCGLYDVDDIVEELDRDERHVAITFYTRRGNYLWDIYSFEVDDAASVVYLPTLDSESSPLGACTTLDAAWLSLRWRKPVQHACHHWLHRKRDPKLRWRFNLNRLADIEADWQDGDRMEIVEGTWDWGWSAAVVRLTIE